MNVLDSVSTAALFASSPLAGSVSVHIVIHRFLFFPQFVVVVSPLHMRRVTLFSLARPWGLLCGRLLQSSCSTEAKSVNTPKVGETTPPRPPTATSSHSPVSKSQQVLPGPYRRVPNIIVLRSIDHPFKNGWEVAKVLRDLRIEFKGQTVIHPDVPRVRELIWHCRHMVEIDIISIDEMKSILGIPKHITFTDLQRTLPHSFHRTPNQGNPLMHGKVQFSEYRKMRLRDIMQRDALELKILHEKKIKAAQQNKPATKQTLKDVETPPKEAEGVGDT